MFVESQKLLEILQYICFTGLILSALAAIIIPDTGKKVVSFFIILVSMTILSFVFYAGIILFMVNMIFIFIFALFYMLVRGMAGSYTGSSTQRRKKIIILRITVYAASVLFCYSLGYIIFDSLRGYFPNSPEQNEINITSFKDITVSAFSTYPIVIIMLIAAAFMTFIVFTLWGENRQKDREV